jgi:predicted transcriptional regulator YdeE
MEPKVTEKGQIILVGFSFYGDPFAEYGGWTAENEIGRLGERFMDYFLKHGERIKHIKRLGAAYEVHVETDETAAKGYREVFMGVEVEHLEDVPVEMLIKILPPATYVVVTVKGEQIASDWSQLLCEWMKEAGYESAYNYGMQYYDERFKGVDKLDESEIEVYVPVKRTEGVSSDGDR